MSHQAESTISKCIYIGCQKDAISGKGLCEEHYRTHRMVPTGTQHQMLTPTGPMTLRFEQPMAIPLDNASRWENERNELLNQLEEERRKVAILESKIQTYRDEIRNLETKNVVLEKELENARKELNELRERIAILEKEVAKRDKEISELRQELSEVKMSLAVEKRKREDDEAFRNALMAVVNVFSVIRDNFWNKWNEKHGTDPPNVFGRIASSNIQKVDDLMGTGYSSRVSSLSNLVGNLTQERIRTAHPKILTREEFTTAIKTVRPEAEHEQGIRALIELIYSDEMVKRGFFQQSK